MTKRDERGEERFGYFEVGQSRVVYIRSDFDNRALHYRSIYVPSSLLRRRRLFPESKILHWFVQIALGLHYMHGRLVLHRDLKTQNIFLLGNGRLVLGDLGISKVCIFE